MSKWKEDDRVRIVSRPVTADDRKNNRYYEHMAGQVGTVQAVFSQEEVAVRVDPTSLSKVAAVVHKEATKRMLDRFLQNTSEEQKGKLTPEELNFTANYVLLVRGEDLEKV
jgi:hypothetical protein